MAAINSLLFLLTTVAPFTEPPEDGTLPYEAPYQWHKGVNAVTDDSGDGIKLCRPDEDFSICQAYCQKTCAHPEDPFICPAICVPGCVCKKSTLRGPGGVCIPRENCPKFMVDPKICRSDEEYSFCEAHCQENCTSYDQPIACPKICISGCVCRKPMVRAPNGLCILRQHCSETQHAIRRCKTGEEFAFCNANCEKNCTNYDRHVPCPFRCVPGCVCKAPMIRGPGGFCIPPEQCSVNTYESTRCLDASDCSRKDISMPSEDFSSSKRSYSRTVKSSFFPEFCKENEEFSLADSICPDTCENYQNPYRACNFVKFPGCKCQKGYVKSDNGECIKKEQCVDQSTQCLDSSECSKDDKSMLLENFSSSQRQIFRCSENEIFSICSSPCPDDCDNFQDQNRLCKIICLPLPKCICQEGFVKGPNGDCIKAEECPHERSENRSMKSSVFPKFCKENEEFSMTDSLCPDTCENYQNPERACNFIKFPGCKCKEGYVKSENGDCIRTEQCADENKQCLDSSECSKEEKSMPPKDFSSPQRSDNRPGKYGLFPDFCKVNEEFSMFDSICPDTCENYQNPERACNFIKFPGCKCKEGYVRSENGICIRTEQCPEHNTQCLDSSECLKEDKTMSQEDFPSPLKQFFLCNENEVFRICTSLCPDTCDNFQDPYRPCNILCLFLPKCVCKEGYVEGGDGECIKIEECYERSENRPMKSSVFPDLCKENEEFSMTDSVCPDTCENYQNPYRTCNFVKFPGCKCKEGYVRSGNGVCIRTEQCADQNKRCLDASECSKEEENMPSKDFSSPQRSENRHVKSSVFPEFCKENEEFSMTNSICPDTCDNYQDPNRACNFVKFPGCKCKEGYVKSESGVCIRTEQCVEGSENRPMKSSVFPKFCKENEEFSMTKSSCPDTCENYQDPNRACNFVKFPGCKCKEGYVSSGNGVCIKTEQCADRSENSPVKSSIFPEFCKANEEFSMTKSSCPDTCENYQDPNRACNFVKLPGCKCKEGYVRSESEVCIRTEQCADRSENRPMKSSVFPELCKENEEFSMTDSFCPDTCENYQDPNRACNYVKFPGCKCKEGYVKSGNGVCIRTEQCADRSENRPMKSSLFPKFCKENEEFSMTKSSCPDTCENYQDPNRACNFVKFPGCKCKEGYVRSGNGVCIKTEQCEDRSENSPVKSSVFPKLCKANEEFSMTDSSCPDTCENYQDPKRACNFVKFPGCKCKEGYVRSENEVCIRKEQCVERPENSPVKSSFFTGYCGINREFTMFASSCPDTCDNYQNPERVCNFVKFPGCKCKQGYVKSDEGVCIRTEQCTDQQPEDCSDNEYYDDCGTYCETECATLTNQDRKCDDKRCNRGCFCKPGYVRDSNWECVPFDDCSNEDQ